MNYSAMDERAFASEHCAENSACPVQNRILQMSGISRLYGLGATAVHALSDIDLYIARGEFVALTGPSGCGKSTLLSIMGLLDYPSSGSFLLNGKDAGALTYSDRARMRNEEIGFVFQAFNLIPHMTVHQNVELPLSYRKAIGVKERRERIREALARVRLYGRDSDYPAQLSGGQQQLVAIARALAGSPALLLADEPTGNLDSESGTYIIRLFEELHEDGATVCIATHNHDHANFAQRRIPLCDGRTSQ